MPHRRSENSQVSIPWFGAAEEEPNLRSAVRPLYRAILTSPAEPADQFGLLTRKQPGRHRNHAQAWLEVGLHETDLKEAFSEAANHPRATNSFAEQRNPESFANFSNRLEINFSGDERTTHGQYSAASRPVHMPERSGNPASTTTTISPLL